MAPSAPVQSASRLPRERQGALFLILLLAATLFSRVALLSQPYFADGPAHVKTLTQGGLFIQPPGYFLFMWTASRLMLLGLSATAAISSLNVAFSVGGVFVFAKIAERLFARPLSYWLSAAYMVMNAVWFAALIHSSYASMTFFGPAVFYCMMRAEARWYWLGCAVWIAGAGFRPSDGAFLSILVLFGSLSRSWRERAIGALIAALACLPWWIPNAIHYQSFLGLFAASRMQADGVGRYISPIRVGLTPRSLANILRFVTAVAVSLNVLLPLAVLEIFRGWRDRLTLMNLAWVLPGSLFLLLVYMSDAVYIGFMAGGLLLLAGLYCRRLRAPYATAWMASFVSVSVVYMLALRPVSPTTFPRRVANAFCLEYTGWAAQHQYKKNLSDLENAAGTR